MAAYIVRRLIWVVFLLFVITLITFIIFTRAARRRPRGAARRPPAVAGARRVDPPAVRARRAQAPVQFVRYLGNILPFVGARRHQLRLLVPVQPGGAAADPQPHAPDDLPDGRRRDPLAGDRHPDRHDLRRQDRLVAGPLCDGHRAGLHLRPGLLPRPRRAVPVRRRHRASSRSCRATRAYEDATTAARQGRGADHAVVRARGVVRRDLRALPARQPDRHACRRTTSAPRGRRACPSGG